MKGYLTSYVGLFNEQAGGIPRVEQIEIPLIQRDYAQGRPDAAVKEIRVSFLEVLLEALTGDQPVGLDFVYGKIDGGTLYPLDGQQRLTTLFLLHWYLASAAGQLDPQAPWTRFSYATRPGARLFCKRLAANPMLRDTARPSTWITDQAWYLHVWRNDPSIQAMLVMIDAIHQAVERLESGLDLEAAWERLTDQTSPAVSFHLLPLDDMESDEDLYIKMNSRGKPLTPFENFKARFEQDIAYSGRADEFAHKIDGAWSDLLWPFHGGDHIVDDEFMCYIEFVTEICELREGGRVGTGRLGPRARAIFSDTNPRALEHLEFLFDAFDVWANLPEIEPAFEAIFSRAEPGQQTYDPGKVVLFGAASVNLFEQCCHLFASQRGGNRAFTLPSSLYLYAVLLHLTKKTEDFPRRVRVLRNLLAASEDEVRRQNMPALLRDVEQVIVNGDLGAIGRFSSNQVQDEKLKQAFLDAHPELADAVFRLEDNPLLRGTLSAFELDAKTFRHRAAAFETVMARPSHWLGLTGALLAAGDYQRRRRRSEAWQFGTSSPAHDSVWRYLLTDGTHDELANTRAVLMRVLDDLSSTDVDVNAYFDSAIEARLAESDQASHFDWRYYLLKYPSMRQGLTGIYHGENGVLGYSMCMLRTTQLNGYYRDPILLGAWEVSGAGPKAIDPWFSGYTWYPRWLRLSSSRVGMRSVKEGFELQRPDDDAFHSRFMMVCEAHVDVDVTDNRIVLKIPQVHREGMPSVDSVDRVAVGAAFLRELVEKGL
ncbi:DUF262 domain-containing protein [Kribbella sp. NPDC051587]|uniref:DUF262 domain-containing protein n=1 Tax=Kribbella sp. NPDC051587 TaxID=3364119 RepID=UPI003794DEBA